MSKSKQPEWMRPFGTKYGSRVDPAKRVDPVVRKPVVQPEPQAPLKAKFIPHGGTARANKQYTGDAVLGIGTMHKSNAVPVFSSEEAVAIAKMRRG